MTEMASSLKLVMPAKPVLVQTGNGHSGHACNMLLRSYLKTLELVQLLTFFEFIDCESDLITRMPA